MNKSDHFIKIARNKFKFGLFLFSKLPVAYISGVRVKEIDPTRAVVSLPFKFLTKNPFKSVYFASQAMAAELSTGVLALLHTHGHQPPISMLVFQMKAEFVKKAKTKIRFQCTDGHIIKNAVEECIQTGKGITVEVKSIGTDKTGDRVAEFYFTWSFKVKE